MDRTFREYCMYNAAIASNGRKKNVMHDLVSINPQRNTEKRGYSSQATRSRSVSETTFGRMRINGELLPTTVALDLAKCRTRRRTQQPQHGGQQAPTNEPGQTNVNFYRTQIIIYLWAIVVRCSRSSRRPKTTVRAKARPAAAFLWTTTACW